MEPERPSLLLVEDDAVLADQMSWALRETCDVRIAGSRPDALAALRTARPDILLLDLCLPPGGIPEEGFRVLRAARENGADTLVVVMSAVQERRAAMRAIAEGAYDFFVKPVDFPALRVVMSRALERQALERENRRLRRQLGEDFGADGLLGVSPGMQRVFEAIRKVADSSVTVILQGESGTGKELCARAIHTHGGRRDGPFVAIHCGALPESLLEAELFGHERGAFTGAVGVRVGRFEAADRGTLFLDEIACLAPSTQIKLLRILEERAVERLGTNRSRPIDIRLIAASNEDLEAKVRRGEFREDLFFRIHVLPIRIPPLRERVEDIALLAEHFLKRTCARRGIPLKRFSAAARGALMARPWPGNVRELRNVVEAVSLMADGEVIEADDLPDPLRTAQAVPSLSDMGVVGLKETMRDVERRMLLEAIARADGIKARAARDLHLKPAQMKHLVRKHGL